MRLFCFGRHTTKLQRIESLSSWSFVIGFVISPIERIIYKTSDTSLLTSCIIGLVVTGLIRLLMINQWVKKHYECDNTKCRNTNTIK